MIKIRRGVFRMLGGKILSDPCSGAWTLSLFGDRAWVAHLSREWCDEYGTSWIVGIGRKTWWYQPSVLKEVK